MAPKYAIATGKEECDVCKHMMKAKRGAAAVDFQVAGGEAAGGEAAGRPSFFFDGLFFDVSHHLSLFSSSFLPSLLIPF